MTAQAFSPLRTRTSCSALLFAALVFVLANAITTTANPVFVNFTQTGTSSDPLYTWKTSATRALSTVEAIGVEVSGTLFSVWRVNVNPIQKVSEINLNNLPVRRVTIQGTIALVALERNQGAFVNIADPLDPKVLSYLPSGYACWWCGSADLLYNGNFSYKMFTESNSAQISVYDTRVLTAPVLIRNLYFSSSISCCSQPHGTAWLMPGGNLYWMEWGVLRVYDIRTDPSTPREIYTLTYDTAAINSQYNYGRSAVVNNRVFLGSYNKITAIDTSDENVPVFLGTRDIGSNAQIPLLDGNRITINNGIVWTWAETAYAAPINMYRTPPSQLYRTTADYIFSVTYDLAGVTTSLSVSVRHPTTGIKTVTRAMEVKDLVTFGNNIYVASGASGVNKCARRPQPR